MRKLKNKPLRFFLYPACLAVCCLIGVGVYNAYKPLPQGLSHAGQLSPVEEIAFYRDLTWVDPEGTRHSQQEIFDRIIKMITGARDLVVLDMFLFNDFTGREQNPHRKLCQEIVQTLVAQKTKYPDIRIVVITDPINTVYHGTKSHHFETLKRAGIKVVFTDLVRLRDSNPLYSSIWRVFLKPFGNSPGSTMPNPFGDGRVSLRSYLSMLNFKANHRKLLICDSGDGYAALVTSANPHDGSSAHGNVAVYFKGPAVFDLLNSENAVLAFSGADEVTYNNTPYQPAGSDSGTMIQILTEGKIKDSLLAALGRSGRGDRVSLVVFYLSDRDIIAALKTAHRRGADLRILLDPNKDAFGREKNGIPNRQVAHELVKEGIQVRWMDTHGEQSHTKMLLVDYRHGESAAILGSANFTRRNLDDLNLETDVAVYGSADLPIFSEMREYVELLWHNPDGKNFSTEYSEYADGSLIRRWMYHWMERTGMSTF